MNTKVGDSPFQGNDGNLSSYFDYTMSVKTLRLMSILRTQTVAKNDEADLQKRLINYSKDLNFIITYTSNGSVSTPPELLANE